MTKITLVDQIRCVRREVAMRTSYYPNLIRSGRLRESQAEHELQAMEAVLATLEELARREGEARSPTLFRFDLEGEE
jgi:hypothetical protein